MTNKTSVKEEAWKEFNTNEVYMHNGAIMGAFNKGFDAGQASRVGVIDKEKLIEWLKNSDHTISVYQVESKINNGDFDVKGDL